MADAQWTPFTRHVDGQTGYGPFLHQDYAAATATRHTSALTGDASQLSKARERIAYAVSRQPPDGYNPEVKGPDTGYSAVGVSEAGRYVPLAAERSVHAAVNHHDRQRPSPEEQTRRTRRLDRPHRQHSHVRRSRGHEGPGYTSIAEHMGAWGVLTDSTTFDATAAAALRFARTANSRRCDAEGPRPLSRCLERAFGQQYVAQPLELVLSQRVVLGSSDVQPEAFLVMRAHRQSALE